MANIVRIGYAPLEMLAVNDSACSRKDRRGRDRSLEMSRPRVGRIYAILNARPCTCAAVAFAATSNRCVAHGRVRPTLDSWSCPTECEIKPLRGGCCLLGCVPVLVHNISWVVLRSCALTTCRSCSSRNEPPASNDWRKCPSIVRSSRVLTLMYDESWERQVELRVLSRSSKFQGPIDRALCGFALSM
jgi:hypothetical protein